MIKLAATEVTTTYDGTFQTIAWVYRGGLDLQSDHGAQDRGI